MKARSQDATLDWPIAIIPAKRTGCHVFGGGGKDVDVIGTGLNADEDLRKCA